MGVEAGLRREGSVMGRYGNHRGAPVLYICASLLIWSLAADFDIQVCVLHGWSALLSWQEPQIHLLLLYLLLGSIR